MLLCYHHHLIVFGEADGCENYLNLRLLLLNLWGEIVHKMLRGNNLSSTALLSRLIRLVLPRYTLSFWSITTYCIKCSYKAPAFTLNRVSGHRLQRPVRGADVWTESLDKKDSIICYRAVANSYCHYWLICQGFSPLVISPIKQKISSVISHNLKWAITQSYVHRSGIRNQIFFLPFVLKIYHKNVFELIFYQLIYCTINLASAQVLSYCWMDSWV